MTDEITIIIIITSLEAIKGHFILYGIYWFYVYIYTHIYKTECQAQIINLKQDLLWEVPMPCYSGGQIGRSNSENKFLLW